MAESDNYSNLDNNNIGNVTEFNNDVYVYGTLYADLFGNTLGVMVTIIIYKIWKNV